MRRINLKDKVERVRHLRFIDSLIGALLSAIAAVGISAVAAGHKWVVAVPLVFTAILLLISSIYGTRAGVIGTVLAAVIFAFFLFNPVGSFSIGNQTAKANLGWMLLLGISFSFLFAPPSGGLHRQ
jgi:K+-sensing histidine kinase KdpD